MDNETQHRKTFDELQIGEIRECYWWETCVACGGRYHPKYIKTGPTVRDMVCASDHKCDPKRLAKREEQLRHEWDDPERYCECDEIDCKFDFLEQMRNEMQ